MFYVAMYTFDWCQRYKKIHKVAVAEEVLIAPPLLHRLELRDVA